MKSMRTLSFLLSLILALSVCFALAACGGTEDPTPPVCESHTDADGDGVCDTEGCNEPVAPTPPSGGGEDDGEIFNEEGELILFKDGVPTFTVIKGNELGASCSEAIDSLVDAINLRTEVDVECKSATSEPTDVEILIGVVTNRGAEYKIDRHSLGKNGYMVEQIGTKIIVLGGDDDSLAFAIDHLKKNVFNILRTVEPYTDLVMSADDALKHVQDDYNVTSVTVGGNDLRSFSIRYPTANTAMRNLARYIQSSLYEKTGIWLETTTKTNGLQICLSIVENDGEGNGYEVFVNGEGNLVFETEFEYMMTELVTESLDELIFNKWGKVSLAKGALDTDDVRNLYYEECGAKGDGKTNDFEYIKLAHDLANEHGHIVHGTEGATYYIGSTGGNSAIVMTDTYWHGCNFIFDDSIIEVHGTADDESVTVPCSVPSGQRCPECADRGAPIFRVESGYDAVNVTNAFAGISLKGGWDEPNKTQRIENWPLDYLALVQIKNDNLKVFIRVGANADAGDSQNEFILVHPDGRIDTSTPLSYDYDKITYAVAYNADPDFVKPITIDGGGATISNIANQPGPKLKSSYIAFGRNIHTARSNTTLKNFNHRLLNEGEYRCPYAGILTTRNCHNVEYRDISLQAARRMWFGTTQQGTYEIGGYGSNDIRFYNVDCINFFSDGLDKTGGGENAGYHNEGEIANKGTMGTNYCRNFHFEGCKLSSFDAHKGLGNATLKDCEFTNILIQGSGNVVLDGVTKYCDLGQSYLTLRHDYGSSWHGDLTIINGVLKYSKDYKLGNFEQRLMVLDTGNYGKYKDVDFTSYKNESGEYVTGDGCYNYNPVNLTIDGFTLVRYTYTGYDATTDTLIGESEIAHDSEIYLYNRSLYDTYTKDVSILTSESPSLGVGTQNRCIASETVTVSRSNVSIKIPNSLYFKNCVYKLDGVTYVWDTEIGERWRPEE